MNRELSFIVHTMQNLHPNDPAFGIYIDILEHLLKVDYEKTVEYIKSIKKVNDIALVSGLFGDLSYHFQKQKFVDFLRTKHKEFEGSKEFDYILVGINEAAHVLNSDEV